MNPRALREASRVELLLLLREPVTLVFALALPVVNVLVMGAVFGDTPDPTQTVFRGVGGSTFYTPAYVALTAASVGLIAVPTQLAGYREHGVLRRLRAAGMPVSAVLGAQVAVALVLSLTGGALVGAISFAANDPRVPDDPWGVCFAFVLGAVFLALLGLMLGALLPTARAAQGAGVMLWFLVLILGGAGPPPEVLPDTMSTLATLTPLRPLVIAMQDPWFAGGWNPGMLAVLVGMGGTAGLVAAAAVRHR